MKQKIFTISIIVLLVLVFGMYTTPLLTEARALPSCSQYANTLSRSYNPQFEGEVAKYLKQYRPSLKRKQVIENVANHKLLRIYTGTFDHSIGDRNWKKDHLDCGLKGNSGEILGAGYADPEKLVQQWLESPAHKAVIDYPKFKSFGVSCADVTKDIYSNQLQSYVTGTICVVVFSY